MDLKDVHAVECLGSFFKIKNGYYIDLLLTLKSCSLLSMI
jgi:hypothetical protein